MNTHVGLCKGGRRTCLWKLRRFPLRADPQRALSKLHPDPPTRVTWHVGCSAAASWQAVLQGEVLLEKQLAASHAVTATVDLAHTDVAAASRRLPRPAWAPVAADLLQPARALLTTSDHPVRNGVLLVAVPASPPVTPRPFP